MHIAIGSTNPVKKQASEAVLSKQYPGATFTAVAVASGVSDQPVGDIETRRGAHQRAQAALDATQADMGVGLEGGIQKTEFGLFTCAWGVIVHRDGRLGVGGSSCIQLPETVATLIQQGYELGDAMDALSGLEKVKHGLGAIGLLTNGLLSRQSAYEHLLELALAPFIRQDWYK